MIRRISKEAKGCCPFPWLARAKGDEVQDRERGGYQTTSKKGVHCYDFLSLKQLYAILAARWNHSGRYEKTDVWTPPPWFNVSGDSIKVFISSWGDTDVKSRLRTSVLDSLSHQHDDLLFNRFLSSTQTHWIVPSQLRWDHVTSIQDWQAQLALPSLLRQLWYDRKSTGSRSEDETLLFIVNWTITNHEQVMASLWASFF